MGTHIETTEGGVLRAITTVTSDTVFYAVEEKVNDVWQVVWHEEVSFGRDKSHRPGGRAFTLAALDQQQVLDRKLKQAVQ